MQPPSESALPDHVRRCNMVPVGYPRQATLPELFGEQVRRTPTALAVRDGAAGWTYEQLGAYARSGATLLRAHGVAAGDVVAVLLPRGMQMVTAVLSVLHAGAVYLPLDPSLPGHRLRKTLAQARATALVGNGPGGDRAWAPLPYVPAALLSAAEDRAEESWWRCRRAGQAAYIIATSGSTGTPKAVLCPHRGQVRLARGHGDLRLSETDRLLATTSPGFDVSCFEVFATLLNGGCLIPAPQDALLDTAALHQLIVDERITTMWLSAGLFHQHTRTRPEMFASLRCLIAGGDVLHTAAVRAVLEHGRPSLLLNGYGPTENSSLSTVHRIEAPLRGGQGVPIGRPVPGSSAYVLTPNGDLAGPKETGELWVGGDGVALGYAGDPALTTRSFVPDRFGRQPGGRLYRTGDLASWRADGVLEFHGRRDRQVKLRGHRVELDEVENELSAHPRVHQCAVDVEGDGPTQRLTAYVVTAGAGDTRHLPDLLTAHLRRRLPRYMVPSRLALVPRLALTPSGKVDRGRLSARAEPQTGGPPPRGRVEKTLASIWDSLLPVRCGSRNDLFSTLGGTSLTAGQVAAATRARLALDDTAGTALIRTLTHDPTLAAFAAEVHRISAGAEDGPASKPIDLAAQAALDIDPGGAPTSAPATPGTVLLTGATGFLGAHLLHALLRAGVRRVICLVRETGGVSAHSRLLAARQRWELPDRPGGGAVLPLPGDLRLPHLGLADDAWRWLAGQADTIVHAGAHVNLLQPYQDLAPTNVHGTRTLLHLATERRLKPVHHISTIAVIAAATAPRGRPVPEDAPLDHPERLVCGYPQTKWVAEHLLAKASARGLPVTVYRPHEISGPTTTGACLTGTLLCALLRAVADTGCAPDIEVSLNLVPVDYVSSVIAHILTRHPARGSTCHITNSAPCDLAAVVARMRGCGHRITTLPYRHWVSRITRLTAHNPRHPISGYLPLFTAVPGHGPPPFFQTDYTAAFPRPAHDQLRRLTAGSGLACPPADHALIDFYLGRLTATGHLPAPADD
ncbi:amino acid adenylation domain-containing protein [Streptomyces pratensis]|uniref:amino acid adenylation domain-containing protein n=1 Tax=Streptomyces pratensis TaxID=1169025 RepID=UPI003015A357